MRPIARPARAALSRQSFLPAAPFRRHPSLLRTLVEAPQPNSGPLLSRRSDRELPPLPKSRWGRTLPVFFAVVGVSLLGLFNYQKQSSSVVTSTLYALRISETGREILGDQIYFRHQVPWISGEINQLKGRIDIEYAVKGTKGEAKMRFRSRRHGRMGLVCYLRFWRLRRLLYCMDTNQSNPIVFNRPMGFGFVRRNCGPSIRRSTGRSIC